jgi:enoyl-CoA hydratase/carnithine racemase
MTDSDIRIDRGVAHTATIVIDRPERSNAIAPATAVDLEAALLEVQADPSVRAVFLRGAGGRSFCGGYDLQGVSSGVRDDELQRLLRTLRTLSIPTVAVVDGHAVGAGIDLACSCDLRIVRWGVKIGLPAVKIGVAYDAEGLQQILAKVPGARKFLLTGELVLAEEVLGFADVLSDADGIEQEVASLAEQLSAASPAALEYMTAMTRPRTHALDVASAREWRDRVLDGPDAGISAEARAAGTVPEFTDRKGTVA